MLLPAKKEDYPIPPSFIQDMRECYPQIDIDRELIKMRAWLISNPNKLKTHRGMKRFINSWLSRAKPEPTEKVDQRGFIEKHTDRSWRQGLMEND